MKNIHSIDTDSFAFTGASAKPANTQMTIIDFPSDAKVMRMVADSHAARNRYVAGLIASGVKALVGPVINWNRKRATQRALADLDTHLLQDIGLERADIDAYIADGKPGVIAGGFAALAGKFNAWNTARQTKYALLRLTDAQLTDIGLTRFDVELLANEIRGGTFGTPATVETAMAATEGKSEKQAHAIVKPVNCNHVSTWFMAPRRVA